jgi:hypothetical protein
MVRSFLILTRHHGVGHNNGKRGKRRKRGERLSLLPYPSYNRREGRTLSSLLPFKEKDRLEVKSPPLYKRRERERGS